MTPKEKAIDLFVKYYERLPNDTYSNEGAKTEAKECALITVNEMLEELDHLAFDDFDYGTSKMMYWVEVKEEIKNL